MTQTQTTTTQIPTGFCPYVPPVAGTPAEQAAWEASYRAWAWEQELAARPAREAQAEALRLNPVPPIALPAETRTVEEVLRDMIGPDAWAAIDPAKA